MTLRSELIQTAAVIVSIIEDLDCGVAHVGGFETGQILRDIVSEYHRQSEEWGLQHLPNSQWLIILMEEVGEAAEEELDVFGEVGNIIDSMALVGNQSRRWLEENNLDQP